EFQERAFGLFLFLALLPTFIPVPAGQGAISGFLTSLIGLQFLLRFEHPWLPGFIANRKFHRSRIIGFRNRFDKWLMRLDKITKPRDEWIFSNPFAHAFSGLLLLLLGISLAVPLPGTNIPFGIVLLFFSFALIERDGRFMMIGWLLGIIEIVLLVFFSKELATFVASWF
ncbi:MAG TPA: exopolysaccharide biosynthesis protein, partial [Arenimonas sp.]|nr:exopolysaccharide biosynthesis protein [Arenimonas sp.]